MCRLKDIKINIVKMKRMSIINILNKYFANNSTICNWAILKNESWPL